MRERREEEGGVGANDHPGCTHSTQNIHQGVQRRGIPATLYMKSHRKKLNKHLNTWC